MRRPAAYYSHLVKDEVRYIRGLIHGKTQESPTSVAVQPLLAANATFEATRRARLLASSLPALASSRVEMGTEPGCELVASGARELSDALNHGLVEGDEARSAAAWGDAQGGLQHSVSMSTVMSQLALLPGTRRQLTPKCLVCKLLVSHLHSAVLNVQC